MFAVKEPVELAIYASPILAIIGAFTGGCVVLYVSVSEGWQASWWELFGYSAQVVLSTAFIGAVAPFGIWIGVIVLSILVAKMGQIFMLFGLWVYPLLIPFFGFEAPGKVIKWAGVTTGVGGFVYFAITEDIFGVWEAQQ